MSFRPQPEPTPISEAARLTGKSRTTLHRLIKTGEL
ncbi:helix-turn-helix domain-containing protein, partial [Klebsiella variicola]